jgi:hypothetical protein
MTILILEINVTSQRAKRLGIDGGFYINTFLPGQVPFLNDDISSQVSIQPEVPEE